VKTMGRLSISKRLENLEVLRRNRAGASIQEQRDVTAAIAEYLEKLGDWSRNLASAPGEQVPADTAGVGLGALGRNPIGSLTVAEYRKMIAVADNPRQERPSDDGGRKFVI
jgi:hypothetical protein